MSDQNTICNLIQESLFDKFKNSEPKEKPSLLQRGISQITDHPIRNALIGYGIHKTKLDRKAFQMGKKAVGWGLEKIGQGKAQYDERNKSFIKKHGKSVAIGGGAAAGALGLAVGTKALLNHLRKKKESKNGK